MPKITLPKERKVGHLTVLRQQRDISYAEFATLTQSEQLEIIHHADGKQKYDLLLNSQNAELLVPRLHPQELYMTINELGATDSIDLLALTSPEQITLLLDLDCWDGDTLSEVLSLRWLELIASTGEEKLCQLARETEPEIFALFLKKHLTIIRGLEAYDDDDAENSRRLESLYDIHYHSEDAAKIIGQLLSLWQEKEQEIYLLIMEMIRSEIISVLEEETYIARSNRLLDLGLIPTHEARSIYTYIAPETFKPGGKSDYNLEAEEQPSPLALLNTAQPGYLLGEMLASGISHETACELTHLVNRKLSADKTDIANSKEISLSLQNIYDTLNLALEYLSGTDIEKSIEIIKTTYLLHLYQLGHSLIEERQNKARIFAQGLLYPYADFPELLFVDTILEKPPLFYRPPFGEHPSQLQPINSLQILALVDQRLNQLKALEEFFLTTLPFKLIPEPEEGTEIPTLAGIFMTAVANQLLKKPFLPTPLSVTDINQLQKLTMENDATFDLFVKQCQDIIKQYNPGIDFFIAFCLEMWEDMFAGIDEKSIIEQSESFLILGQGSL